MRTRRTTSPCRRWPTTLNDGKPSQPLDPAWVKRAAKLLESLKDLRWRYVEGPTQRGRASMGMVNSTGCTSVWGSTYPYHPYPFPWTSHLFQDSPSVAMGLFEGHMAKMADGFKAVRMAEMELKGDYVEERDRDFFNRFSYEQFTDEEWHLCPPVVSLGGDGAMYDIGFQNLSRMMMAGKPIKVLVVDTQVYSNTGGQACTSGFVSQVSDMAPYGSAQHGKTEIRKEMSLIAMAHRSSFVLAEHDRPCHPPAGGLYRRSELAPSRAVQHLCGVPARTWRGRRSQRRAEQAGGGKPRLSAVPLRSRRGRDVQRRRELRRATRRSIPTGRPMC